MAKAYISIIVFIIVFNSDNRGASIGIREQKEMKWEYHFEATLYLSDVDGSDAFRELYQSVTSTFKQLGQEDWELVSVDNGIAYFKRISKQDAIEAEKFMQELTYSAIVDLMKSDR